MLILHCMQIAKNLNAEGAKDYAENVEEKPLRSSANTSASFAFIFVQSKLNS